MNVIGLLVLLLFGGGGAVAGLQFASYPGAVIGALLGVALRCLLGHLLYLEGQNYPSCSCGTCDYETEYGTAHGIANICKKCAKVYVMRKGRTWYAVLDEEHLEERACRKFLGGWKSVDQSCT